MSIAPSVRRQTARAHYLRDRNAPNGSRRQVDGYSIKEGFERSSATIAERKTEHNMNDCHRQCLNSSNLGCDSECSQGRDTNLSRKILPLHGVATCHFPSLMFSQTAGMEWNGAALAALPGRVIITLSCRGTGDGGGSRRDPSDEVGQLPRPADQPTERPTPSLGSAPPKWENDVSSYLPLFPAPLPSAIRSALRFME